MSLPKHLESKAPTESWWVNKSRAEFAEAQAQTNENHARLFTDEGTDAMSEPLCKNCGHPRSHHVYRVSDFLMTGHPSSQLQWCRSSTSFEPKPEPMKAKPGVRYRYIATSGGNHDVRFGTPDGKLRWCGASGIFALELVPMSSDWIEVPE